MRHAIELALKAWGDTHPNPMVGAVIVEAGEIVAQGWHRAAGQDHAEVVALKDLGRRPNADASLYVTLEPCSTCGRTGACTEAIIDAGFRRVVVGAQDPNPAHRGRGLEILRGAGIQVVESVLGEKCVDLNLIFNHWITAQTPLIAAKIALTLDGKFAAASGQSKWVTGEPARADVMHWRRYFPAIAVSASTVLRDDPSLTSRFDDETRCPRRFILDRSLQTIHANPTFQVFTDSHADQTIVVCGESTDPKLKERAVGSGIILWELPESRGHLDWLAFRRRCVDAGIYGVYVEAGPTLASACIENGLADYWFVYQAPKFLADAAAPGIGSVRNSRTMADVWTLRDLHLETLGEDRLSRGFLSR